MDQPRGWGQGGRRQRMPLGHCDAGHREGHSLGHLRVRATASVRLRRGRETRVGKGRWRRGLRKPAFHPEMVAEEHGVAGASPCE